MRNVVSRKTLFLLCNLASCSNSAFGRNSDDCCPEQQCCDQVYDCGNPLNCGAIDFQIQAGVAPTLWTNRGIFSAISCNALSIPNFNQSIIPLFKMPRFNKLFKTPWIIGGHIGYALTNDFETYIEFNYRQASGRNFTRFGVKATPNDTVTFNIHPSRYKVFDVYLGARYYWGINCGCYDFAVFFGGKFGMLHRKQVNATINVTSTACPSEAPLALTCVPFFYRSNSVAAGANVGFEWCLGCNFSAVFTAEAVATCGPRSNSNIANINPCATILPNFSPTNLVVGGIGTEVFFPITVGLKYSF